MSARNILPLLAFIFLLKNTLFLIKLFTKYHNNKYKQPLTTNFRQYLKREYYIAVNINHACNLILTLTQKIGVHCVQCLLIILAKKRRAPRLTGLNSLATLKLSVRSSSCKFCMQSLTSYLPSSYIRACRSNQHCKLDLKNTIYPIQAVYDYYSCAALCIV